MNNGFIIQTHDLRKTYRVGKVDVPALRGVNLRVKPGEFLAIVGPSGSGKSTLFHIIGGLTPPTSGEVHVAGQDLASLTDAGRTSLRKRTVGFVFQKFNLLPNLTARDNIAVARYIGGTGSAPDPQFEEVLGLLDSALGEAGLSRACVTAMATVDAKAGEAGIAEAARARGWALVTYSASQLAKVQVPRVSRSVLARAAPPGIAEAAALAGAHELVVPGRR